jgi:hypothetical protein
MKLRTLFKPAPKLASLLIAPGCNGERSNDIPLHLTPDAEARALAARVQLAYLTSRILGIEVSIRITISELYN